MGILFPKAALGISPPSTRSAFGSNHLSSGSLVTEAETPLDFLQQTTMAAKPALSNTPSSWDPFVPTHGITTTYPNNPPPISYTGTTSPSFPPPNPPRPPTDGFPSPPYPLPGSVRHHQHPPRPAVCTKDFKPSPEDATFNPLMNRARAQPGFREPAMLKKTFCRRNKGPCPCPSTKHKPSMCFIILIGPSRGQCRTESVALRDIQKVLGLCWSCNTW